ncbi:GNAT family N-acetyltransferase [Flavobacterium daejeonense]|uniref:GNAT family N-acetyltransferase n=1 Tax=Flavobacterium daejeonense TaxID=350893 RepID=UPI00047C1BC7|nr:GNAT family N-acetyltransferase [Flavobacterium daejeonense]
MNIVVKNAKQDDLVDIAKLFVSNWKEQYKYLLPSKFLENLNCTDAEQRWFDFLNKEEHNIFVAYQDNNFLGFIACNREEEIDNCLYVFTLQVSDVFRGKGIGSALLKEVAKFGNQKGYRSMSICIIRGNDKAKKLYVKLGAIHYKYFIDNFDDTVTNSEKLIWDNIKDLL